MHNQGVFSNDIMFCFNDLVSGRKIEDRFPLKALGRVEFKGGNKERIDNIISKFKEFQDYDLENTILLMLGIDPGHKQDYYGVKVRELIKEKLLEEKEKTARQIK